MYNSDCGPCSLVRTSHHVGWVRARDRASIHKETSTKNENQQDVQERRYLYTNIPCACMLYTCIDARFLIFQSAVQLGPRMIRLVAGLPCFPCTTYERRLVRKGGGDGAKRSDTLDANRTTG
ncbi:hypothetical protein IscW_ISCW022628 [Ixodes scapularis]|uniref:Uncharacterized protein n=1 Tax=Ixodes scapularis TaxID=6945 RepID=B7QD95_IXOSC|nr:hypothetical protein IscW_ISCW022628 [Ixodes scapularis]|eukprot:XP_002413509.1 hypothetical protein IscW_ISCW022628 [Ixodes scapularis]